MGFVVVGQKRLVAIDPARDEPAWTSTTTGDGISFAPALVDGKLVVADQGGIFMALDAATGKPLGPGFRHPAEVAPTTAPITFGPGRIFAPLTDGSALVLPISELIAR